MCRGKLELGSNFRRPARAPVCSSLRRTFREIPDHCVGVHGALLVSISISLAMLCLLRGASHAVIERHVVTIVAKVMLVAGPVVCNIPAATPMRPSPPGTLPPNARVLVNPIFDALLS